MGGGGSDALVSQSPRRDDRGLLRVTPRSPEAEEAIQKLSLYLAGQAGRVGYAELRRRGLPRGSGGIESANKLICHVRLKRSGRGGSKPTATPCSASAARSTTGPSTRSLRTIWSPKPARRHHYEQIGNAPRSAHLAAATTRTKRRENTHRSQHRGGVSIFCVSAYASLSYGNPRQPVQL